MEKNEKFKILIRKYESHRAFGRPQGTRKDHITWNLNNRKWECEVDSTRSGECPTEDSCEHYNTNVCSIKVFNFLIISANISFSQRLCPEFPFEIKKQSK